MLGEGLEELELPLGVDDEGDVVATLVRHRPNPASRFAAYDADIEAAVAAMGHGRTIGGFGAQNCTSQTRAYG